MNKFLIFGDSYADEYSPPHPSIAENNDWQDSHSYRWTIKLKEKFKDKFYFKNMALQGSSPYSALSNLLEYYNDLNEDDIIIFFLSDFDRIDFKCPDEIKSHISNIFYSNHENNCQLYHDGQYHHHKKLKAYYLLNESELNFFYKNFFNILPVNTIEMLFMGFLKNLSEEKKCKLFLFRKEFENNKPFFYFNTKYFYQFDKHLSKISDDEYDEYFRKEFDYMIKDERINHLSPENHEVMFQIINKLLLDDYDLPEFKQKLYKKIDEKSVISTKTTSRKFIYE